MKSLLVVLCAFVTLFLKSSAAAPKCCSCDQFSDGQQKQLRDLLKEEAGSLQKGMQMMCPKKPNKWHKLQDTAVCFGAKEEQHGTFTINREGFVAAIKLEHKSGSITCNNTCGDMRCYSRWGCSTNNPLLGTFITTQSKGVLFPREEFIRAKSMTTWYALPGFGPDSDFLVFHDFAHPYFFHQNQELQLWYGEDLKNVSEKDNDGQTCVDVFAWYL